MIRRTFFAAAALVLVFTSLSFGQPRGTTPADAELRERRNQIETELESLAVIDRKVMVPMRDGLRMQADIPMPANNNCLVWTRG